MIKPVRMACLSAAVAALATLTACGSSGGSDSPGVGVTPTPAAPTEPAPAPAATVAVPVTVMDGLITGATVCLDVNGNGACETGDILAAAATNASGVATIAVPEADIGKYPVVAFVPVGATDADSGPVTTAYTLMAPADQTAVVSPLTTAVQLVVASTGVSSQAAADTVRSQSGLSNSLLANYVAAADSTAGNAARVLVAAMQSQISTLLSRAGQADSAGVAMSETSIKKAILAQVTDLLTAAVAAGTDAAVVNACADKASAACKSAVATAAGTVVASKGLTNDTLAAMVALDNLVVAVEASSAPSAGFLLDAVNVGDASNWYSRIFTWTAAEDTPDSNGLVRYRSQRHLKQAGVDTVWANNNDPARSGDLHWNGSAWVGCTVDTLSVSRVWDAQGRSVYEFCDGYIKGHNKRVSSDISGKTMNSVFALIQANRTDGSNWGKAPTWFTGSVTASVDGASFPPGSRLQIQSDVPTEFAFAYDVRNTNVVNVSSAAAVQGGDPRVDGSVACYADSSTSAATTLEMLVARSPGKPCLYFQSSFTAGNGVTYSGPDPETVWWMSTVSLGNVGTAPLGTVNATSYYSGNIGYRLGFEGGSSTVVTYYACPQSANANPNSSLSRNCGVIGKGNYTIQTLGDARVMTLTDFPAQMGNATYDRAFIERGGKVYFGYKSKPTVTKVLRLNGTAGNAVLSQLGLATIAP